MPISEAERGATGHLLVDGLVAGYNRVPVLRGVSMSVSRGEVVTVVGPNGSGKSTLAKAVMGVVSAMQGEVRLESQRLTGLRADQVARIGLGYVPQVRDVFEPLTVKENLEMGATTLPKSEIGGRIETVLESYPQLRTLLNRQAGKLSGGERKMLAMGRALMLEPALVVLDEPTANLAPAIAAAVLNEHVRQLAATGASVLVVEQRARAVLEISDRTYVLGGGQLVMEGAPGELSSSPEFVESFLGGARRREAG